MTINTQKIVIVLGGPTGPTGTFEGVNILGTFTGRTGQFPQWAQATGNTGPHGTFKSVYNIGPTGVKGEIKTVIIPGFTASGGGGGGTGTAFNPADQSVGIALSDSNFVATNAATLSGQAVRGLTSHTAGKFYLEFQNITLEDNSDQFGLATAALVLGTSQAAGCLGWSRDGTYCNGSSFPFSAAGDPSLKAAACIAIDLTAHLWWIRGDAGIWNGSGTANPATGAGGFTLQAGMQGIALFPWARLRHIAGAPTVRVVTGAYTSAGAHAFLQAVPAGFSPWS